MGKTQVLGAAVLVLALAGLNTSCAGAVTNLTETQKQELSEVVERAKVAREMAAQNPSTEYLGLSEYIDELISAAEANEIEDVEELILALDDAAFATPLLLGINQAKTARTAEMTLPQAAEGVAVQSAEDELVATNLSVKVENTTDNDDLETQVNDSENDVEVPATGEVVVHKAGVLELMIAGVIVVAVTLGLTGIILKSRKN